MNGIPNLLNKAASVFNTVSLLSSDVAGILGMFSSPQWGIYLDGEIAIQADSVFDLTFRSDSKVSTYPLEGGKFESFNKVQMPFDIHIRLTKGGSNQDRKDFLDAIDDAKYSFDLYTIMMPETTYDNVSITHYDFKRSSTNGVSLLTVDIRAEEIIQNATVAFTDTKNPASQDSVNGGNISTKPGVLEIAEKQQDGHWR